MKVIFENVYFYEVKLKVSFESGYFYAVKLKVSLYEVGAKLVRSWHTNDM